MNGHIQVETLALSLVELGRRPGRPIGDTDDAPLFIFAAGWGCGEREIQRRLIRTWVSESTFDPALVTAMGWQLVRSASCAQAATEELAERAPNAQALTQVARTQAIFLRGLCRAAIGAPERHGWGAAWTGLSGDHALYLKLLFPRAKFIFLHRDPIDTFCSALRSIADAGPRNLRDPKWAESFAEHWCRMIASFELWHKEVGGIMIGYDRAIATAPGEVEAYLCESLLPGPQASEADEPEGGDAVLRADERGLLVERTAAIAARLGYTLRADDAADQRNAADQPNAREPKRDPAAPSVHTESQRISCAILVPAMRYIEPECEEALSELERRGYALRRLRGCSAIDQGRNILATGALDEGFDATLWVDADTGFDPDVVEKLRSHDAPIVAGICARKRPLAGLAVAPLPGTRELEMGEDGELIEVLYAGTGFLLVRSEVYRAIQQRFRLPLCDEGTKNRMIPFFMPMLEDWGGKLSYLGEDYAFSRRARLCGYKVMADTSIRLWHIGMYR